MPQSMWAGDAQSPTEDSRLNIPAYILTLLMTAAVAADEDSRTVELGDGSIDGEGLTPYKLRWQQCSWQDGEQVAGAPLIEALVVINDFTYRLRQISDAGNGVRSQANVYLDRQTLAPQRLESEIVRNGERVRGMSVRFASGGYEGTRTGPDGDSDVTGAASNTMLHGMALGLPLAAMGPQDTAIRVGASMVAFDATYDVTATWVGPDELLHDGQVVESWMVDVDWHHRENGDRYPPGPDASGGRYWVVSDPPSGFPHVPIYKTDTYAVEFVSRFCD